MTSENNTIDMIFNIIINDIMVNIHDSLHIGVNNYFESCDSNNIIHIPVELGNQ